MERPQWKSLIAVSEQPRTVIRRKIFVIVLLGMKTGPTRSLTPGARKIFDYRLSNPLAGVAGRTGSYLRSRAARHPLARVAGRAGGYFLSRAAGYEEGSGENGG